MVGRFQLKPVVALCLLGCGSAFAGYAQMSPPSNWASNTIRVAANDVSFTNGIRSSASAVISVGGKAVAMPAAYRFAANAPVLAARAAYLNPSLFAALAVGTAAYAAYEWYTDNRLEVHNNQWVTKHETCPAGSTCYEYTMDATKYGYDMDYVKAWDKFAADFYNPYWQRTVNLGCTPTVCTLANKHPTQDITYNTYTNFPSRRVIPPSVIYEPVTAEEMEQTMVGKPIPAGVPQQFPVPDFDWPVEPKPIINPSPQSSSDPMAAPLPQPMRIPMGEPQPVPNTSPQEYKQPVTDVVPAPTDAEPWRVDLQPKDIVKTSPESQASPEPVPVTPPEGSKTEEKQPALCELFPDILACAKPELNTPESDQLERVNREVTMNTDSGWGSDNAACPAPRHLNGANIDFTFDTICAGMSGIRPVVLAFAWLGAALILLGARARE